MGTVINTYVIPRSETPASAVRELARALLTSAFLELPAAASSPFRENGSLLSPQTFDHVQPSDRRTVPDVTSLDREVARASGEPLLLRFPRLNPDQPDVRRQFDHYTGAECAVGLYAVPEGHRLLLTNEFAPEPLFDERIHAWVHLEGKAAPWKALLRGSALEQAIRSTWGELRIVENDAV